MDTLLIHRAMFRASGSELHDVAGLIHEYNLTARLAETHGTPDDCRWTQSRDRIEECLRLYVGGSPIRIAKRLSGYAGATIGEG
jgi:hypothetical protein